MGKILSVAVVLAMTACGGEEVPSCQQAFEHYYGAGCVLYDLETGQPYSAAAIISNCKDLLAAAPDQCIDEMEDYRSCFGGVRSPATSNADCDCSNEQDALLTCE